MATTITLSRHIDAPIDEVFTALTHFAGAAEVIGGIEKVEMLTDGPVAVGTRFRETRIMFGREATEEMEVVSFDRPRSYALRAESHGSRYLSTFELEERDGGTGVRMDFEAVPLTVVAKVMAFLLKGMMKKVMAQCGKDLDDVKRALETQRA